MKVCDEAGSRRVKKHRLMRKDKGFVTIEIPYRIEEATKYMDDPGNCVVLLECVANLVGNAMHEDEWYEPLMTDEENMTDRFAGHVLAMISELDDKVGVLVVVSSEYEPDEDDDNETALYKRLLKAVNDRIVVMVRGRSRE